MKKEDLTKLGLTDNAMVDALLKLHSKDIEKFKTAGDTAKTEIETFKIQLAEANKQIEGFKGMDIEGVKKAADEYKTKFEKAEADYAAQLEDLKFTHALDSALALAKAKNPKAVKPLLDLDVLKKAYDTKTETIIGFDEHLKPLKEKEAYLFTDGKEPPVIVKGANNQAVTTDAFESALWKGAKLTKPTESA